MTVETGWDAVVVGAGIGGLTCAALLSGSGRRVLVLEQHDVAGGSSHVFRRRRAYEFDVGVHYVGDCGPDGLLPTLLRGLGLADRIRFQPMDQDGFDRIMLPGLEVDVPADWSRYRSRLTAALPAEAAAVGRVLDVCQELAAELRDDLVRPDALAPADMPAQMPVVTRWARRTLKNLFDHNGLSAVARTVLAAQSINYGIGPAQVPLTVHASVIDHYVRGAYRVVGGGQMLAAALVELIESHGGQVRTRTRVDRILVAGERIAGVDLADGGSVRVPVVVSNADYRTTVLDLLPPGSLPEAVRSRTRAAEMALPYFIVYVAVDREIPRHSDANLWWYPGGDIEAGYRALAGGSLDEIPFLFVSFAPEEVAGARRRFPPGHTVFQVMTLCPEQYLWCRRGSDNYRRDASYRAEKSRLVDRMLSAAESAIGPFRSDIVHVEAATPLTHQRYTGASGGTPYGFARWGHGLSRPDTRTALDGLYVVGAATRYGSGIAGVAVGGAVCAGQIIGSRLIAQAWAGRVFADPGKLPVRGPGWDPLRVSRGALRRDEGGLPRLDGLPTLH